MYIYGTTFYIFDFQFSRFINSLKIKYISLQLHTHVLNVLTMINKSGSDDENKLDCLN